MIQHKKIAALPTIRRLPHYLRILKELSESGDELVSGTYLAQRMHCEPIQVRKDLAVAGAEGRPRRGFDISSTISAIEYYLGWKNTQDAFLVGVGSLGSALLGYSGFQQHNLNIVAAFDTDAQKIGRIVHGREILNLERLQDLALRMHINLGIITAPASSAQAVADYLVDSEIRGIWNFSPIKLEVPTGVIVQNEDLSSGLAVLCRKLQNEKE